MTSTPQKPELLAPVGNFAMLNAAINAGADSVYFGIRGLNMRVRARNFTLEDLPEIINICHTNHKKAYLALNTIVYEQELPLAEEIIQAAKAAHVDAIICWDAAVIQMVRQADIPIHLSTQASTANSRAIQLYQSLGVERFVLARECSLEQIKELKSKTTAEIETFIHGAMCVSESGRCFISQFLYGKSANRGECLQPCRRQYRVTDVENNAELVLGSSFVMSPRDMCTVEFLEKLIEAGIDCFKIEGRARSPEYVKTVVDVYRRAIDAYFASTFDKSLKEKLVQQLKTVYHREFSTGFYLGKPINEWTSAPGSQASEQKTFLGLVRKYYRKALAADVLLQAGDVQIGDKLVIIGNTTGAEIFTVDSIHLDSKAVPKGRKGQLIGIRVPVTVRRNDEVYKLIPLEKNT